MICLSWPMLCQVLIQCWDKVIITLRQYMGLLPDRQNCGLRMRRECRERFPRHQLQRKTLVSDPGMHQGTCVTHVPWCMSRSLTRGCGENVPGIPGACATRNFTYLARGPCCDVMMAIFQRCVQSRLSLHTVCRESIQTKVECIHPMLCSTQEGCLGRDYLNRNITRTSRCMQSVQLVKKNIHVCALK